MRSPLAAARVVSAAALVLAAGAASAAHRITTVRAGTELTYVFAGDKVRVVEKGSPRVLVFDGKAMQVLQIDTATRSWAVATLADAKAEAKALSAKVEAQDAALPADERERARGARRDRLARWTKLLERTQFEQTSNQGMVAGQICDGFAERVDGKVVAEGCYIPWDTRTIRKEDVAAVTRLAEFLGEALAGVDAASGLDVRLGPLGRLDRAPGFPALRYDVAPDGKSGVQLKVVEFVNTMSVTPGTFSPPADFTKLDRPAAVVAPLLDAIRERAPLPP